MISPNYGVGSLESEKACQREFGDSSGDLKMVSWPNQKVADAVDTTDT